MGRSERIAIHILYGYFNDIKDEESETRPFVEESETKELVLCGLLLGSRCVLLGSSRHGRIFRRCWYRFGALGFRGTEDGGGGQDGTAEDVDGPRGVAAVAPPLSIHRPLLWSHVPRGRPLDLHGGVGCQPGQVLSGGFLKRGKHSRTCSSTTATTGTPTTIGTKLLIFSKIILPEQPITLKAYVPASILSGITLYLEPESLSLPKIFIFFVRSTTVDSIPI